MPIVRMDLPDGRPCWVTSDKTVFDDKREAETHERIVARGLKDPEIDESLDGPTWERELRRGRSGGRGIPESDIERIATQLAQENRMLNDDLRKVKGELARLGEEHTRMKSTWMSPDDFRTRIKEFKRISARLGKRLKELEDENNAMKERLQAIDDLKRAQIPRRSINPLLKRRPEDLGYKGPPPEPEQEDLLKELSNVANQMSDRPGRQRGIPADRVASLVARRLATHGEPDTVEEVWLVGENSFTHRIFPVLAEGEPDPEELPWPCQPPRCPRLLFQRARSTRYGQQVIMMRWRRSDGSIAESFRRSGTSPRLPRSGFAAESPVEWPTPHPTLTRNPNGDLEMRVQPTNELDWRTLSDDTDGSPERDEEDE